MILIGRAFRNLLRNPWRTVLVTAALSVVIALGVVGLAVEAGALDGIRAVRQSLGGEVVLGPNVAGLRIKASSDLRHGTVVSLAEAPVLTEELANGLAGSPYVVAFNHNLQVRATSQTLKPVDEDVLAGIDLIKGDLRPGRPDGFSLVGDSDPGRIGDFRDRRRVILEGRLYTAEEVVARARVAVIDEVLAAHNNLQAGSTFELIDSGGTACLFTVVGVSRDQAIPGGPGGGLGPEPGLKVFRFGHSNTIHLPYTAVQDLLGREGEVGTTTYYLDDPGHVDAFRAEAQRAGLDTERYTLWSKDTQFEAMSGPLLKLAGFARAGVIAVVVAGALVTCLVMTIVTRERGLEIGVLRALGATRRTVAAQLTLETLALCLAAMVAGVVIGGLAAQGAANHLLAREAELAGQSMGFGRGLMALSGAAVIQWPGIMVEMTPGAIDTQVGVKQIAVTAGIGLFLGLLGSLVAAYWSMRTDPAGILAGRA